MAIMCREYNYVGYTGELTKEDLLPRYSADRLIGTELSTLHGLMLKAPISFDVPKPDVFQNYIDEAKRLLEELHQALVIPMMESLPSTENNSTNPFADAAVLRESIFYSAESAYSFQYREWFSEKYGDDTAWITKHKHFNAKNVSHLLDAILHFLNSQHSNLRPILEGLPVEEWSVLPACRLDLEAISKLSCVDLKEVESFVDAFAHDGSDRNATFSSLSDYNVANAYPILKHAKGEYYVFQFQALAQAAYETPFYWMSNDAEYCSVASNNRGVFAERLSESFLSKIFGEAQTYRGVDIYESKGKRIGEVDVLAVFGDRAIVLQAKTKRLTLKARKGNDGQLQSDFKKAVQQAADQAFACAEALLADSHKLVAQDGSSIQLAEPLSRILPICVVADHYPSLSFQSRQFLKIEDHPRVAVPLVTDVFALDAITEMLNTPLRLLSYLELRAKFGDQLLSGHELTLLSYHLKMNLWVRDDLTFMMLGDDISVDLDIAMTARRESVPGQRTPEGILTKFVGTPFDRLISQIEREAHPTAIELGLLMLELDETSVREFNRYCDLMASNMNEGAEQQDFTMLFGKATSGITVHRSRRSDSEAKARLSAHCQIRKYISRSDVWFGILLSATGELTAAVQLKQPWKYDPSLEEASKATRLNSAVASGQKKPGRNSPCPCGSGKKYKRCCLPEKDNLT
nr:SEC-C metal-binding domain-containing protein [Henriciella aquimarina]